MARREPEADLGLTNKDRRHDGATHVDPQGRPYHEQVTHMLVQPYLSFDGRCEEALDFYRATLGAEIVVLMRFSDSPVPPPPGMVPPGTENKIMHATFRIGESTLLASDGECTGKPVFQGISLAIETPNIAEAERVFAALSDGGRVNMPLAETFFSSRFGMVADRFGVPWMITVAATPS